MKNSNSNNCNFCRLARFPLHFTLTRFLSTFSPLLNSPLSSPTLTPSLHLTFCPLILPTTSPPVPSLPVPSSFPPPHLTCPLILPTTSPPIPSSFSPPHPLSPHPSHHLTPCPLILPTTSPPIPSSFPPPHPLSPHPSHHLTPCPLILPTTSPSSNRLTPCALLCRRGIDIVHIRIQSTEDYYDLYGGETFATLAELIEYYTENLDTLKETSGEVINLLQPVYTEQVTMERYVLAGTHMHMHAHKHACDTHTHTQHTCIQAHASVNTVVLPSPPLTFLLLPFLSFHSSLLPSLLSLSSPPLLFHFLQVVPWWSFWKGG